MQTYLLQMLGLGPLADAMQNPDAQAQVLGLIKGIIETRQAVERIEMKLDVLLADRGLGSAHYPQAVLGPTTMTPPATNGEGQGG